MTKRQEDDRHWKIKNRPYIVAAVLALVMTMFVAPEAIEDNSMAPTLVKGNVVVITKDTYSQKRGLPAYGELVILQKDAAVPLTEDNLIARVAALPGERVEIRDGTFYRDGKEGLPEGVRGTLDGDLDLTLSDSQVFLLSDNLGSGMDSRSPGLGPVEMEKLKGQVRLIIWPLSDFGGV